MARMPGQGVAASVGGPTTPGTATTEVQEQGVPPPPPGLHPPDFTNWSLPFPEAPPTGGLSTPSGGPPSIGRDCRPTDLGSKGPGTAYAGAECPPGNAARLSAEAAPACYPISASSAAAEPTCYSLQAGNAAIKPACYTVPAGCAATQEVNRKGIVGPTYLRQSRSCT